MIFGLRDFSRFLWDLQQDESCQKFSSPNNFCQLVILNNFGWLPRWRCWGLLRGVELALTEILHACKRSFPISSTIHLTIRLLFNYSIQANWTSLYFLSDPQSILQFLMFNSGILNFTVFQSCQSSISSLHNPSFNQGFSIQGNWTPAITVFKSFIINPFTSSWLS